MRRVIPVTAAVAVLATVALTGCANASNAETCEPAFGAGPLSDSVSVAGDSADNLSVQLRTGTSATTPQRTVLERAAVRDEVVVPGSIVAANLAYVDASSGEILQVSPGFGSSSGDSLFQATPEASSIVAATVCAAPGDTLAIALSEQESAAMGIDGSLVVVAQVTSAASARAEGRSQALPSGFPAIAVDAEGRPGVVLPPQAAPTSTESAARIVGEGEKVESDSSVIGNVLTVDWDGRQQQNTWEQGPLNLGTEADVANSGFSFRSELTGYPVGSQVIVIEPGEGTARVSVVDILAAV